MIIDTLRPIKNSDKIQSFLRKCIDLINKIDDLEILDKNQELLNVFKLESELEEEYLELKFLENLKKFWNKFSNG